MEWIVTTGKTIEEATEAALDELGVDEDELEVEVLEEPKAGLFGMVRREARLRARVAPAVPRPKAERRPRKSRSGKGAKGGTGGEERTAKASTTKRASRSAKGDGAKGDGGDEGGDERAAPPAARRSRRPKAEPSTTPPPDAATEEEPAPDAEVATSSRSRGRPRRPRGDEEPTTDDAAPAPVDDAAAPEASTEEPAAKDEAGAGNGSTRRSRGGRKRTGGRAPAAGKEHRSTDDGGDKVSKVTMDEQIEVVEEFLDGLLEAFDLDGDIATEKVDEDNAEVRVEGDDLGLLIGPKGQTLNAVQDLARTVVQRRLAGSLEGRVRVDVGGYRQRRRAALERFAQQVAEDVISSGNQKVLEPMNPADRKVVHDTINEIDGVSTISEGEEPRRRVVVQPVEA